VLRGRRPRARPVGLPRVAQRERGKLAELAARGFFERAQLERALTESGWKEAARPASVLVPVEPRSVGKIPGAGQELPRARRRVRRSGAEEPLFFEKLPETLVPAGATVSPPAWYADRFDHEAELAVVIGKGGAAIAPERALEHVLGYTVADDLTLRTLQGELARPRSTRGSAPRTSTARARSARASCRATSSNLSDARVRCTVNGAPRAGREHEGPGGRRAARDRVRVGAHDAAAARSDPDGHASGVGPLADGDEVVCSVSGIGELRTRIARTAPVRALKPPPSSGTFVPVT
jgi:fumarylpyruvate hydrolase